MNLLNPISSIMTKDVITLSPDASISQAAEIFNDKKIHHIPVVNDMKLIGIVSKSDYLFFRRGFLNDNTDERIEDIRMNNYEVQDIMTQGIATMEPTDKINVALEVFKENMFHAIPIVEDGNLKGIVTTYDIISTLAKSNGAVAEYTNV
ncbi:MAG: CBS domain-containing protein [Saprospiraceae bacterium]|nr:CBS domain-containing protein [Bacteroidia bacterium]NNE14680.1 CBS domain-containing protein [Saprospiraceae bacterium]NNL93913.1 CBS domain-containing protein [Saprospiraceae bacterium]